MAVEVGRSEASHRHRGASRTLRRSVKQHGSSPGRLVHSHDQLRCTKNKISIKKESCHGQDQRGLVTLHSFIDAGPQEGLPHHLSEPVTNLESCVLRWQLAVSLGTRCLPCFLEVAGGEGRRRCYSTSLGEGRAMGSALASAV